MLPILQLGPLSIQTGGLIMLVGLLAGLSIASRFAHHFRLTPEAIDSLVFKTLIAGVIGGRIGYFLLNPQALVKQPLTLFSLSPLLFDLQAAVLVGGIFFLIYCQRKQMPIGRALDGIMLLVGVLLIAWPLAQWAVGTGFGIPTRLPWGINLWGTRRHPIQLYQLLASVAVIIFLLRALRTWSDNYRTGSFAALALLAFSLTYVFVEGFRDNALLVAGSVRLNQLIAFTGMAGSLVWLWLTHHKQKSLP